MKRVCFYFLFFIITIINANNIQLDFWKYENKYFLGDIIVMQDSFFNNINMIIYDNENYYFLNNTKIVDSFYFFNDNDYMIKLKQCIDSIIQYNTKKYFLIVSVKYQRLFLINHSGKIIKIYPISTSKYGIGNKEHSNKTPLGLHEIIDKIGDNEPIGRVFRFLKATNEIASIIDYDSEDDYITTRILRLNGLQDGINKGKGIDSYDRHIYIHGTAEEGLIGTPASHGCIRMYNKDVVELFDFIEKGTFVYIMK